MEGARQKLRLEGQRLDRVASQRRYRLRTSDFGLRTSCHLSRCLSLGARAAHYEATARAGESHRGKKLRRVDRGRRLLRQRGNLQFNRTGNGRTPAKAED